MKNKCAIMQPHFLPWSGYFNLISKVDKFIFLDDAQYSKNSWQNRNYILSSSKKLLINIPVIKSPLDTKIKDKLIDKKNNWKNKTTKIILQSYSKSQYYDDLKELVDYFLSIKSDYLSDYNIKLIKFVSKKIKINNEFLYSSKFNSSQKRTKKLINILEKLNVKEYLSPVGAKDYLIKDKFENLTDIKLSFNEFKVKKYSQFNQTKFVENLSIIDVVANLGWINAEDYVKSQKFK